MVSGVTFRKNMEKKTKKANSVRSKNADDFAEKIIGVLDKVESENGYKFKSLNDRIVALNYLGVGTSRGGKWTKTQMSRVLKRYKKLSA